MEKGELEALIMKVVEQSMKPVSDTLKKLTEEVVILKRELTAKDEKIRLLEASVENKLDELEQYGRRNNLRIFGVPVEDNENTDDIVIGIAKSIGVNLDKLCIDRSHRIGNKDSPNRPIIVKFTSYAFRKSVFDAKKSLKGTKTTVREDLTSQRMRLLKEALSKYGVKRVWTTDGVIKINVDLDYPRRVKTQEELRTLLMQYPPATLN